MEPKSATILDDRKLLKQIVSDGKRQDAMYRPGPYWEEKTKNAVRELTRQGMGNFRGSENGAGNSFTDNILVDIRSVNNFGLHSIFSYLLRKIFPFNRLFDHQVKLTDAYSREAVKRANEKLSQDVRLHGLLDKYQINFETTRGGCGSFLEIRGKELSHHYLELLWTLDHLVSLVPVTQHTKFMEIGGGFGTNVHLLAELFGVRKFLYLDIAPNLYVGTQYLKSFYGESVIDYSLAKGSSITFSKNSDLEIFCLLPHQIQNVGDVIDVFHNAHSFVEMPRYVVQNYAGFIKKFMSSGQGQVSLVSYDSFDSNTTFNPDLLPSFFGGEVKQQSIETLVGEGKMFSYAIQL